jgi:hypothetical protein
MVSALGHGRRFQNLSQFITHQRPYHSTLYSTDSDREPQNNPHKEGLRCMDPILFMVYLPTVSVAHAGGT